MVIESGESQRGLQVKIKHVCVGNWFVSGSASAISGLSSLVSA